MTVFEYDVHLSSDLKVALPVDRVVGQPSTPRMYIAYGFLDFQVCAERSS